MRALLLLLASSLLAAPATGRAQVRTRAVLVHWYRYAAGLPPSTPGELVALDCVRNVSPPFRRTRCHEVVPTAIAHHDQLLAALATCYGAPGGRAPPRPSAATVETLRRAFETSRADSDHLAVALPNGASPLLALVRWTDVGIGSRCVRFTRHCTGIDCNMG